MSRRVQRGKMETEQVEEGRSTTNTPWQDAIQRVLGEADGAMSPDEIARRIVDGGLRKSVGATPAQTVAAMLSTSLRDPSSPYLRVSRGLYTLRGMVSARASDATDRIETVEVAETGALKAFGMYWQRERVMWTGTPRLLGKQGSGATEVNFAEQVGVYLLHDRQRVIYVGRATDNLYVRLKAHTLDRLSGRWDRFSWFGLRGVSDTGALTDSLVPWTPDVVVETMEALLIESLEPPLNRKRGDNLSALEFVQSTDPQFEKAQQRALFDKFKRTLGID